MIDIHSHVLPGVDDGAVNLQASLSMAEVAVKEGITKLIATPHHRNGRFENEKETILDKVSQLNRVLKQENLPLSILPGQEIRIYRNLLADLDNLLTLNNKGKYLFIELPSSHVPDYTFELMYEILLRGIIPIIVHPERNIGFVQQPKLLLEIVNEGVLTQITASSYIGKLSKKIKSFSEDLIENNLTHFISSDAHNISNRGFDLRESYQLIEKKYGKALKERFQDNASLLVKGQHIITTPPSSIERNKVFGLFKPKVHLT